MPEMARCTVCELVEPLRPDWHCSRCGSQVDLVAPKRVRLTPVRSSFPRGSRFSGAIHVAVASLSLLLLARHPSWLAPEYRLAAVVGAVLGFVIGVLLLQGQPRARPVAIVLVGCSLVAAMFLAPHPGTAFFAASTLSGHLLLLLGDPGWIVIGLGVLLATPALVVNLIFAFS